MSSAEKLDYQEIYRNLGYVPFGFGMRIRQARTMPLKGNRMTQAELEAAAGLSVGMVASWEAQGVMPRRITEVVKKISEVTGYSAAWLLGIDDPRNNLRTKLSLISGVEGTVQPELPLWPTPLEIFSESV